MNAKKELLKHIGSRDVEYVSVYYRGFGKEFGVTVKGTLDEVLPKLDFRYDDGYGGQELFGHIWYADGTWSDREEYDGSEWWAYRKCPERD